jgi:hypothetical protein
MCVTLLVLIILVFGLISQNDISINSLRFYILLSHIIHVKMGTLFCN